MSNFWGDVTLAGTTDCMTRAELRDSSNAPITDAVADDVTASYQIDPDDTPVALPLVDLASVGAAHTDGGWIHIQNGVYRLDLPDAVLAASVAGKRPFISLVHADCTLNYVEPVVEKVPDTLVDLTQANVRTALGLSSANLDTQFAALATAAAVAAVNTIVAAIKGKTDNLPASPAATGDIPPAGTIADAVWDEDLTGHDTAGTTGAALAASSASYDPWETVVPGSYDDGTAGGALGRLNNTPADAPVLVTPDPSGDANLRTVFVDTRDILGEVVTGLAIEIQLASPQPAVATGGQVVSKRSRTMEEDSGTPGRYTIALEVGLSYLARQGDLFGPDGKPFDVESADTTVDLATA